jgi:acyl-coenzyme A thioesterase PaaI-like protein
MTSTPVQHLYAEDLSHCYGCGKNNAQGLHIQTHFDGEQGVGRFTPRPEHIALPGFVYGGMLASVATAAAAAAGDDGQPQRYVTASLHVDFLRPTPLGPELELVARVIERRGRKIVVAVEISALGEVRVRGQVVAAPMPRSMGRD